MAWSSRYTEPDLSYWRGRQDLPDAACFFQNVKSLNLLKNVIKPQQKAFALLGFCCDEGIQRNQGRIGAAEGPKALRTALSKLPFHRQDYLIFDAGDITCLDGNLESSQSALGEAVFLILQNNITPILIGGGHEMAYGHYQGIHKHINNSKLGIINFDAHFDMRPLLSNQQGSSGTPFLQVALAQKQIQQSFHYTCIGIQPAGNISVLSQTAKQFEVAVVTADDIVQNSEKLSTTLQQSLTANEHLYLSICLDVFAAAYAPGVSAPQALGLTPWQLVPAIRRLAASGKIVSYDIAELSPKYDIDTHTAKLAAHLIFEIIHHHI